MYKRQITGSGEVTILVTGYFLKSSDSNYVVDAEENGETQTVDNPVSYTHLGVLQSLTILLGYRYDP